MQKGNTMEDTKKKKTNLGKPEFTQGKFLVFVMKNGMKVLLDINKAAQGLYQDYNFIVD